MKIKLSKLAPFLMLLMLGASMLHISLSYVLLLTVLIMLVANKVVMNKRNNINYLNSIKRNGYILLVGLIIFALIQISLLEMNLSESLSAICIIMSIFVYALVQSFFLNPLTIKHGFLTTVCYFDILFSIYYLYRVARFGLPEDRDSVLGYVSSNYCAAILYLTFPLILYSIYTLKKDNPKWKKLMRLMITSIFLSIVVILLSGSRTAFGVVLLMLLSLVLLKQDTIYGKIKSIAVVIMSIIAVIIVYIYVPSVRQLLDRAMTALEGRQVVTDDVRTLAWAYALQNFQTYNHLIGSGSNIVYQFSRPAHNLFLEILLSTGYIGIVTFVITVTSNIWKSIKGKSYKKKFFILQLLIVTIIVAYVQPFFSTAFTAGIIVWGSVYTICFDEEC